MKAIMKGTLSRLCEALLLNAYSERQNPSRFKFYSNANLKVGRKAISNRSAALLNDLDFDWKFGMTEGRN